jgi:hypothetical protein
LDSSQKKLYFSSYAHSLVSDICWQNIFHFQTICQKPDPQVGDGSKIAVFQLCKKVWPDLTFKYLFRVKSSQAFCGEKFID